MRQLMSIMDVMTGDIIVEDNGRIEVKKIDRQICKHHTHINDKDCWDNNSEVLVQSA